jgi:uncharacterized protein (TIGR03790 family)
MPIRVRVIILLVFAFCRICYSLEPNEVFVISNSEIDASVRIARYYCQKRGVPAENFVAWPLGTSAKTRISRDDYNRKLAELLRARLTGGELAKRIKCLLTTYGVPIVVEGRGQLEGRDEELQHLKDLVERGKDLIKQSEQDGTAENKLTSVDKKRIKTKLAELQLRIDFIVGRETNASVDSELSMVMFGNYELYRWQVNRLQDTSEGQEGEFLPLGFGTLMVSRLDGPGEDIIMSLVDKAISAEKSGLKGTAYFDSRGIYKDNEYGIYDQSIRDLAMLTRLRKIMPVEEERTSDLFAPGSCPQTGIYCGWYSLKKYIDAFDFVDGAIGYHIASFEAANLRDPNSSNWCPAMLADGITATLGPVTEPYLHSFPKPKAFFEELYNGKCLVEAFYRTKPFNSWRLLLIGDPLYRPFKQSERSQK